MGRKLITKLRRLIQLNSKEQVKHKAITYFTKQGYLYQSDSDYPFSFWMKHSINDSRLFVKIANFYPGKNKLRQLEHIRLFNPRDRKVIFYANDSEHRVFNYSSFSPTELLTNIYQ